MKDERRPALIKKLAKWHDEEKHRRIVNAIEKIDPREWDYEISGFYARALNNLNRYEEALEILRSVEQEGAKDGKWHFRVGYSLLYLGREAEAADCFRRAIEFGDDGEDTRALLEASITAAGERQKGLPVYHPELYTENQVVSLEDHISRHFGAFRNVYHELASPDIHVDIAIIEPEKNRNYYTLITMGMGARRMNVPPELDGLERAELAICLPPDWRLDEEALASETWYWPIRWLKILARLPGEQDTWLGWGHTVPAGEPFAENTEFCGILLLNPGAFDSEAALCETGGERINFYQMIPLYQEEMDFKINNSTENLLDFFDDEMLEYVRIGRKNTCRGWNNFSLKKFNLAE